MSSMRIMPENDLEAFADTALAANLTSISQVDAKAILDEMIQPVIEPEVSDVIATLLEHWFR
jgi:hypothetical protein